MLAISPKVNPLPALPGLTRDSLAWSVSLIFNSLSSFFLTSSSGEISSLSIFFKRGFLLDPRAQLFHGHPLGLSCFPDLAPELRDEFHQILEMVARLGPFYCEGPLHGNHVPQNWGPFCLPVFQANSSCIRPVLSDRSLFVGVNLRSQLRKSRIASRSFRKPL